MRDHDFPKAMRDDPAFWPAVLSGFLVLLIAVLWLVCFCVSILVSALLVYGLWDLGRFLLGG